MPRVEINGELMAVWLQNDPAMKEALKATAENLMAVAQENAPIGRSAPWGPFKGVHGYFKRRFRLKSYRGGWQIWNVDPFAHLVEWGSARNPAYAPIRRAIRSSHLRYKPNPQSRGE